MAQAEEQTFNFGRFGKVWTYQETASPSQVVLFISGDGGWNLGVVEMARALARLDTLVIGVDVTRYLKNVLSGNEKCIYPASDFEALNQFVQKEKRFPEFKTPLLAGYSSGATLAYATLAQSPADTFQGAISLGFCPDLPLSKPMCSGHGLNQEPLRKGRGFRFLPRGSLEKPWIALHGEIDRVCSYQEIKKFSDAIPMAELIALPKVGHGFSVQKNWMPQFKQTFNKITKAERRPAKVSVKSLNDLPLIEIPSAKTRNKTLAVIISGDGGWAAIDKQIGDQLNKEGFSVVGFNSLRYFWKKRTPDETANDFERILRGYLQAWHKEHILLIGYSFGADVLPVIANKLDASIKNKISKLVLLAPGKNAHFEFKLSQWLGPSHASNDHPLEPEINKVQDIPVLCIFGKDDGDGICPSLNTESHKNFKTIQLDGGHHFGKEYKTLTEKILGK